MHCIDMNAWYSRVDKPERPDWVLFDLDPPDEPDAFALCVRVAHLVTTRSTRSSSRSYVKTSGADGIHVLVPIARRSTLRRHVRVRGAALARTRARASGRSDDGVAEEEAIGRARRSPPERAWEDDRVGLLGAAEAGSPGLDAARVGGADRERAAARLHDGGRARSRGGRVATSSSRCCTARRRSARRSSELRG